MTKPSLFRAELLRLKRSKAVWIIPGIAVFALALSLVGNASIERHKLVQRHTTLPAAAYYMVGIAFIISVFSSVGGVIQITSEFRSRSIGLSTLICPTRTPLLVAKAKVAAAIGAVYGLVAVIETLAVSKGAFAAYGFSFPVTGRVVLLAGLIVVVSAAGGIWGVFLGALLRSQLLAVAVTVVYTTMVEAAVVQYFPVVGRWLPGGAQASILADPSVSEKLSRGAGAALLAAWIVAMAAVVIPRFRSQDI